VWLKRLSHQPEIIRNPLGLPTSLNWSNFTEAWVQGNFSTYFVNSIIITIPVVLGSCSFIWWIWFMAFQVFGNRFIFTLSSWVSWCLSRPLYSLYFDCGIGLLSTYWGVILPSIAFGLPFGIFLMRAFSGMLTELAGATLVDGCNEIWRFLACDAALTKPAFPPGSFRFMWTWNNFIIPYLYLQQDSLRTLPWG
jgi:raffinose/stachyose/melibiose transport system permease protein